MDGSIDYILEFDSPVKDIMLQLHEFIISNPGIYSKITYGIPFYYRKSWICYINPRKNSSIELAFTRGNELSNIQGILNPENRKQVAGVIFHNIEDINLKVLNEVLQEAILLDEEVPYAFRRKRGTG